MRPIVVADAELNAWAESFVASSLGRSMSFEAFMELPRAMRARRLSMGVQAAELAERIEAGMPAAVLRGDHLVEPLHHHTDLPAPHWRGFGGKPS